MRSNQSTTPPSCYESALVHHLGSAAGPPHLLVRSQQPGLSRRQFAYSTMEALPIQMRSYGLLRLVAERGGPLK